MDRIFKLQGSDKIATWQQRIIFFFEIFISQNQKSREEPKIKNTNKITLYAFFRSGTVKITKHISLSNLK